MATVANKCHIEAPPEVVFRVLADPKVFAQAIEGVTTVEFLSSATSGVGTRYRQTRAMNGKSYTMDFEITEYVPPQRVRIVNETHGTVWDAVFTLVPAGGGTDLVGRMDTRSKPLLARIMMPLVCLMIRGAVQKDLDAVKSYCERPAAVAR
jgi:uncharacterized protein YndB with AHSA1/START domain